MQISNGHITFFIAKQSRKIPGREQGLTLAHKIMWCLSPRGFSSEKTLLLLWLMLENKHFMGDFKKKKKAKIHFFLGRG